MREGSRFVTLASKGTSKGDVDTSDWRRTDQLLAVIADLLVVSNWQRTGSKSKPEYLFLRPDETTLKPRVPQEEVRERLKRMRTGGTDG